MKATEVKTLNQLVEFINEREDWSLEVSNIIANNGWHDETGSVYGVCSDGKQKVAINEQGQAEVITF